MWIIAFFSYVFNVCTKLYILAWISFQEKSLLKRGRTWRSYAELLLNNPSMIFISALFGPRWNCHSTMARLGPFHVKQSINIHTENLSLTDSWTAVIYDHKVRTVTASNLNEEEEHRQNFTLPPGNYTMQFRYYGTNLDMHTPSVFVDGQLLAKEERFENDKQLTQDLYKSIQGRHSTFYFLLQYHAFYLQKHKHFFPDKWVNKTYRPVPNPETSYFQGYIKKGSSIKVTCESKLFEKALVFISIYNESSFPEFWGQIQENEFSVERIKRSGGYLIRVVSRKASHLTLEEVEKMIQISNQP